MTSGHSEYTDATERSNSPAIIRIVTPSPTTPNWTALARIDPADAGVRKCGESAVNTRGDDEPGDENAELLDDEQCWTPAALSRAARGDVRPPPVAASPAGHLTLLMTRGRHGCLRRRAGC